MRRKDILCWNFNITAELEFSNLFNYWPSDISFPNYSLTIKLHSSRNVHSENISNINSYKQGWKVRIERREKEESFESLLLY